MPSPSKPEKRAAEATGETPYPPTKTAAPAGKEAAEAGSPAPKQDLFDAQQFRDANPNMPMSQLEGPPASQFITLPEPSQAQMAKIMEGSQLSQSQMGAIMEGTSALTIRGSDPFVDRAEIASKSQVGEAALISTINANAGASSTGASSTGAALFERPTVPDFYIEVKDPNVERVWDSPDNPKYTEYMQYMTNLLQLPKEEVLNWVKGTKEQRYLFQKYEQKQVLRKDDVKILNQTRIKIKTDESALQTGAEYVRQHCWRCYQAIQMCKALERGPMGGKEIDSDKLTIIGSLCATTALGLSFTENQVGALKKCLAKHNWDYGWVKRIIDSKKYHGCKWVAPLVELDSDEDESWKNK